MKSAGLFAICMILITWLVLAAIDNGNREAERHALDIQVTREIEQHDSGGWVYIPVEGDGCCVKGEVIR